MRRGLDNPQDLKRLVLGWRLFALLLVLVGLAGIVYMQSHYLGRGARFAAWMTLGLGAMIWAGIVIQRDRRAGAPGD